MKRMILFFLAALLVFSDISVCAQTAQPASIAVLIEKSASLQGGSFTIRGELLGETPHSEKDGFWLNISEEGTPIGVFCPYSVSPASFSGGFYERIGDVLEISGTLQRICLTHSGELDFHAQSVRLLKPTQARVFPPSPSVWDQFKWVIAGILVLLWNLWKKGWEQYE